MPPAATAPYTPWSGSAPSASPSPSPRSAIRRARRLPGSGAWAWAAAASAAAATTSSGRSSSLWLRRPGRASTSTLMPSSSWAQIQPVCARPVVRVTASVPPVAGSWKPCAQPSTVTGLSAVPSRVARQPGSACSASRRTRPSGPAARAVPSDSAPDGTATGSPPGEVITARVAGWPATCHRALPLSWLSRVRPGVVSSTSRTLAVIGSSTST